MIPVQLKPPHSPCVLAHNIVGASPIHHSVIARPPARTSVAQKQHFAKIARIRYCMDLSFRIRDGFTILIILLF